MAVSRQTICRLFLPDQEFRSIRRTNEEEEVDGLGGNLASNAKISVKGARTGSSDVVSLWRWFFGCDVGKRDRHRDECGSDQDDPGKEWTSEAGSTTVTLADITTVWKIGLGRPTSPLFRAGLIRTPCPMGTLFRFQDWGPVAARSARLESRCYALHAPRFGPSSC